MTRPAQIALLLLPVASLPLAAQPAGTSSGIQRAVAAAREHLRLDRPADAVAVLEVELLDAGSDVQFLNLLREAYTAHLRDLESRKADPVAIESVRRRLHALTGKSAGAAPEPPSAPATILPPLAPPVPEAPPDLPPAGAATGPAPAESPPADVPPALPGPPQDDPFQQPVRDSGTQAAILPKASEAFAARQYARAAELFAEAARRQEALSVAQRDEWAYSRLHGVAMRLNRGGRTADTAALLTEVNEALKASSGQLAPFATQLLNEIRRRGPTAAPAAPGEGWQVVEGSSFRILHRGRAELAAEVGQTAEAARKAMYERWAGVPATNWSPRCDVYLHSDGPAYAKGTGKAPAHPGHSTVQIRAGRVVGRRIDLRLDEPTALDGALPAEVTQVVLADLFADQPLPKWALVGMAALAESPECVARYQRAVPGLLQERKLFAVGPFLDQPNFPDPTAVTAFYAESVSLVAFLVELKGPKAFTTFLREAPRRGFRQALTSHYGFRDPAELQDRWVRHVLGGE